MLVIDNFISDQEALHSINISPFWEDNSYYWKAMDMKWRQRWEALEEKKGSIGEYLVNLILDHPEVVDKFPVYSPVGFEYWPTILMAGMDLQTEEDGIYSLNIHTDFDLAKYKTTGEVKYPLFGAIVYFGNEEVEGGELRVWETNDITNFATVKPINNRLVVFDSHKPHGVFEVTKGIRKSIAINFWSEPIMLPDEGTLT